MTEVPEYLLERSRERRQALGLGDDGGTAAPSGGGDDAPAGGPGAEVEAAPAPAAAPAEVVEAPPAPPEPEPPWVEAARTRHRVPMWVMPVLFLLPLWAYVYVAFLGSEATAEGALVTGAELYVSSGCSGCHGGGGGGGVGWQLSEGEVLLTFPEIAPMMDWISRATDGYGTGTTIGDPDRPGGPHIVGQVDYVANETVVMPAFGEELTPAELFAVTRYVRETLSGEELTPDEELARDELFDNLEIVHGDQTVTAALEAGELGADPTGMAALLEGAAPEDEQGGAAE